MKPMPWPEVWAVFLRAAFLSINGSTTLALLRGDLVERLGQLTPAQFATGVSVGAATPGPLGYGCIALGFLADGWRGAIIATITSWMPAFLAIPLRAFHRKLEGRAWLAGITWGIAATGTGLLLAMVYGMLLQNVTGGVELTIFLCVLALLMARAPLPAVIGLAAAAGAIFLK